MNPIQLPIPIKKRNNRRKNVNGQARKAYLQIQSDKVKEEIPKLSVKQVHQAYNDPNDVMHPRIIALMNHLKPVSSRNLTYAIGLKISDEASQQLYQKSFNQLTAQQKRLLLQEVLADDWSSVVKMIASSALPHLWRAVRNSSYGQKALKILKEYAGIDMNDDSSNYLGNPFTIDPSLRRGIQWDEMSAEYANETTAYDGVSVQAISSILFPEFTSCRIPNDISVKCGLLTRTQTFLVPSNSAGSAIVVFFPLRLASGGFIQLFNDSSLNTATGAQDPAASQTAGPLSSLSTVVTFRTTGFAIEVEPIVSSFNNQGRVSSCMSDGTASFPSGQAPVGTNIIRDTQYLGYQSVAGVKGHRLAYHDSSVADEDFVPFTSEPDADFIELIVEGAAASTNILQITYTYQAEYTIKNNPLIELALPPTGPATMKCLAASLSQNPQLRMIGKQEAYELYCNLLSCRPRYSDVMNVLVNHKLKHKFEGIHTGYKGPMAPSMSGSYDMDFSSPVLATE